MLDSLLNLLVWLFVVAVVAGCGVLVYSWLGLKAARSAEVLALSTGLGFLILIYGTTALAWMGLLTPMWVYGGLAVLFLFGLQGAHKFFLMRRCSDYPPVVDDQRWSEKDLEGTRWFWFPFGVVGLAYILSTMAPPLDGDTLHSYLDVPRRFVNAGGIVSLPFEALSAQPLNMQMLSAFSLIVRGEVLAQMLVGFTMAAGTALIIYILGYRYISLKVGLWASLFFLVTFVVGTLVPSTKGNLGRAFFDLLAVYAIARWAFDQERRNIWLIVGGIFSGAGFASSYAGAPITAVLAGIVVLVSSVQNGRFWQLAFKVVGRLMMYGLPILLLGGPWLLRNYLETGNPVFPVLNGVFIGREFTPIQYSRNAWDVITMVWQMSTQYAPFPYGRPIGPVFLALLPGVLLIRPRSRPIKWALFIVGISYVLHYFVGVQRPRNFLAELGLLAIIASWSLLESNKSFRSVRRVIIAGFALLFVFEMVLFVRLHFFVFDKLDYVAGLVTRDQYLEKNLETLSIYPNWEMVGYINRLPKDGAGIVSLYNSNDYYIDADVRFFDSRMTDGVFENETLGDPNLVLEEWRRLGVLYVFVNEYYLRINKLSESADYQLIHSPVFQEQCLNLLKKSGQQYLYRLECDHLPQLSS